MWLFVWRYVFEIKETIFIDQKWQAFVEIVLVMQKEINEFLAGGSLQLMHLSILEVDLVNELWEWVYRTKRKQKIIRSP